MSFSQGFSIKAIPFPPLPIVSGSGLLYDGLKWVPGYVVTDANLVAGSNLVVTINPPGIVTASLSSSITNLNLVQTTTASITTLIFPPVPPSGSAQIQTVSANNTLILVSSSYVILKVTANVDAGNISYVGGTPSVGQVLFIQVSRDSGNNLLKFNNIGSYSLGQTSNTVGKGSIIGFLYDGAYWTQIAYLPTVTP